MDEELKRHLEEGESVLWNGAPEKFETLDKTYKPAFIRKACICAAVAVVLSAAYLFAVKGTGNFKIGVEAIIVAACLLAALSGFTDAKKIRAQEYCITDSKLLWKSENIHSIPFSSIKDYSFVQDDDGHTSLLIGEETVKAKKSKWRVLAASPAIIDENTGICERAVFYAIPDAAKFKKIFESALKK